VTQEINLLGPQFRPRRRTLNSAAYLGPLLIVFAIAGFGFAMFQKHQANTLRKQLAAAEDGLQREQDAQRKLAQEVAQIKKDPALEAEVLQIERRLMAVRLDMSALKEGAIGETRGFSDFMRALAQQSIDGVWLTGFSVGAAGDEISISGRALRAELVPAYLKRLGQDPFFSGRSFAALDIAQSRQDARAEQSGAASLAFSLMSRREATDARAPGDKPR